MARTKGWFFIFVVLYTYKDKCVLDWLQAMPVLLLAAIILYRWHNIIVALIVSLLLFHVAEPPKNSFTQILITPTSMLLVCLPTL